MPWSEEDCTFVEAFESCTLPGEQFQHQDHVKLAWLYLSTYTLTETLARYAEGIKRFARAHGQDGLYHETITWAYILVINERMQRGAPDQSWEDFATQNADLLARGKATLQAYYTSDTLSSELARATFVLPDRIVESVPA